ncbi:hypothetical protein [Desulfosarcina cetonica]|uniref:hypothetical protein n=1 Tax=Desulfosarcina cetonica TaxID=90730 RepID=UPI0006CF527E|nr:hypothetical protein [Desulfosarcina cetonica]
MHRAMTAFSLMLLLGLTVAMPAGAAGAPVYLVALDDAVTPATADFLIDAIHQAGEAGAGCLVVRLDTPGGLVESTRKIVMAIYDSKVPVVVYVAPSGARAARPA